ncbi:ribonuclease III [Heliocybe sulcata]|uniref:Large ribosomal subunit protein mL44 n=1 Tax=Heliocybe sulcata TaxID=5364 RepID=A0A5C3NB89_9AGAM|nr:ribonuclease III [Heliocybe sulcata]
MHGYVHKRLASSIAKLAVSPSAAKAFPPPEAIQNPRAFQAEIYAALQPPPVSSLSALAHRLGLGYTLSPEEVQQACTHPSFVPLYQKYYPKEPKPKANANLASLGNSLLGVFAAEYVSASYPYMPTNIVKAAVSTYVGNKSCSAVASEIGAAPLLRWHRTALLLTEALASISKSMIALVYKHHSLPVARQIAHDLFLSRQLDMRALFKFRDPKKALKLLVDKFNRERPTSRLLSESGRFTNSPVFVVGIYSGADQLGEGFGSSLKMAEHRAAEDSLLRLFLTRTPPEELRLPSSTFSSTLYVPDTEAGSEPKYAPGGIAMEEILYATSGKSGHFNPTPSIRD